MANKTIITVHPPNKEVMAKAGINESSSVASVSVGKVMHILFEEGYKYIRSYTEVRNANNYIYLHFKQTQ